MILPGVFGGIEQGENTALTLRIKRLSGLSLIRKLRQVCFPKRGEIQYIGVKGFA
jgi:hypothetical protein